MRRCPLRRRRCWWRCPTCSRRRSSSPPSPTGWSTSRPTPVTARSSLLLPVRTASLPMAAGRAFTPAPLSAPLTIYCPHGRRQPALELNTCDRASLISCFAALCRQVLLVRFLHVHHPLLLHSVRCALSSSPDTCGCCSVCLAAPSGHPAPVAAQTECGRCLAGMTVVAVVPNIQVGRADPSHAILLVCGMLAGRSSLLGIRLTISRRQPVASVLRQDYRRRLTLFRQHNWFKGMPRQCQALTWCQQVC